MKTICLNMIVKNESKVIKRCLTSIRDIIDYWVIVDTGSMDGTQSIIRECLKDIPGELWNRPWVNFGHNRNEAMKLASNKADYLMFLDADQQIIANNPLNKNDLTSDCYIVQLECGITQYLHILLINNHPEWHWENNIHEWISNPLFKKMKVEILPNIVISNNFANSHRAETPETFQKDAQILLLEIEREPTNSRYVYYLAQSYLGAGEYPLALQYYEKRAEMGGEENESFWTLFCIATLKHALKMSEKDIIDSYWKAYQYNPLRLEPLYNLSYFFTENGHHVLSYLVGKMAVAIPAQNVSHLHIPFIYHYGMQLRFAEAALKIGNFQESHTAYRQLLTQPNIPGDIQTLVKKELNIS
ncbi:MAG: hypothetical protein HW387_203 [Parachlamydiales bacterium]|nr:hypothetical protein [Parachlamydiales bacterium]